MKVKAIKFSFHDKIYKPNEIRDVLQIAVNDNNLLGKSTGVYYYNIPCAFDIETSSFYRDEKGATFDYPTYMNMKKRTPNLKLEKCAIMYVWQFGINGFCFLGRTWEEFTVFCREIAQILALNDKRVLICYVHNLAFEFQFLQHLFKWVKVFATDERKPLYARNSLNIEFRCSYLLSGYPLEKLGEQLQTYKVNKMVGDLNYNLLRHNTTPLTEKEIKYCINDINVVMAYIQEEIENNKGITHIPLTKTGKVRKFCRKNTLRYKDENGKQQTNYRYIDLMNELQINGMDEFTSLKLAFQGGFTHANGYYNNEILENVASYDFTSSYPYVMISELFPMTRGVKVNVKSEKEFNLYLERYLSVINIAFYNLMSVLPQDNPISVSKTRNGKGLVTNNGRVVCADYIETTITNVDYNIIKRFYRWDSCDIGVMWCYGKGYLPTCFVRAILELYAKKTTLKGVKGKEYEYLQSKEMLNSCYGMTVTNIVRDEYEYTTAWQTKQLTRAEQEKEIRQYNLSKSRFLSYAWGVFVTAYARYNLFTGIYATGDDYVYSDTDSIKLLNHEKYKRYFDEYNGNVIQKLRKACKYHNIPFDMCSPKTIKGITKTIGLWDFEGIYNKFKTLGAKRYMTYKDNEYNITVSGVNKNKAVPYMVNKWGNNCMVHFTENLYFPPVATGKNIHTYIDYPITGEITDYKGEKNAFCELSGVHLEPTDYHLNLSVIYMNYLRGIKLMG